MRRSRCWNVILGIVVGAVTVAALLKLLVKPQPKPVHDPDRPNILCKLPVGNPEVQFSLPRPRVSYGTGPGATVRGWPPKGGFLIMTAGPADLEFLGYDRFQIVWQPDPEDPNTAADEEAHCYKSTDLATPLIFLPTKDLTLMWLAQHSSASIGCHMVGKRERGVLCFKGGGLKHRRGEIYNYGMAGGRRCLGPQRNRGRGWQKAGRYGVQCLQHGGTKQDHREARRCLLCQSEGLSRLGLSGAGGPSRSESG